MQFSTLRLASPILQALTEEGYTTPTPIQSQAIPPVIDGHDLLGCAQTGTGKTAAFALPILNRLFTAPVDKARRGPVHPRALILSPTRELANQIGDSFAAYGRHTHLTHAVVYGGVSQHHQVRALRAGVDILVATPGRLIDLMQQRHINFSSVQVLVLDEADRMLDMGFIAPIRRIVASLPLPRQTLMFSATMPREIMHLADSLLNKPVKVAVTPVASAAPLIEQSVYMVPRMKKQALLEHLLGDRTVVRALVFTRTKHGADKVTRKLNFAGITAGAIHGNKAQNQRERALDSFRTGRSRVLVATDVAARGLDVDAISHVFNFDLPVEAEGYVHRIGRTGRAGATGIAVSFCDIEERGLLRDIEKLTGKKVNAITTLPALPETVHAPAYSSSQEHSPVNGHTNGHASGGGRPSHAPSHHSHHRAPASQSGAGHHGSRPAHAGTPHGHSHNQPTRGRGPRPGTRQGKGVRRAISP